MQFSSRPTRTAAMAAVVVLGAVSLGACSDSSGGTKVAVTGTDDACELARDVLPAGKVTFDFTNEAKDVNELYVVRPGGEVVSEVEGVTTGTSRTLNVDLSAGKYQVRCKPGMKGSGFSSDFTVTGEGGAERSAADRTVAFDAVDFTYQGLDVSDVRQGETIRFRMTNGGDQPHEFEVLGPDGEPVGEIAGVEPGEVGIADVTFAEAGDYAYQCILVDPATDQEHTMLGMKGTFTVQPAAG